ncbi:MAG: TetR/AcrR family transcriptional regulator [Puia sp.]|nr:TetR/AcrR family transcriptional regulator [Puia sp.]
MSITDRRQRQKEEVRTLILDAAWEMVVTEGWPSFSIRKIADAIEYSVPVIYSHFENKDAILLEFNRKGFRLLAERMEKAKSGKEYPAAQIDAMAHAYWDFAFTNYQYYQLMFGLGIPTCETARKIPEMNGFKDAVCASIEALTPAGRKASVDPFLKYQSFWSMLHGLVSINMVGNIVEKQASEHGGLAEMVLNDVIGSFIKGIVS